MVILIIIIIIITSNTNQIYHFKVIIKSEKDKLHAFTINTSMMMVIQFFIYLRTELNSQWPITESARIRTTAKDSTGQNEQKND
jgi:hypothetical protein